MKTLMVGCAALVLLSLAGGGAYWIQAKDVEPTAAGPAPALTAPGGEGRYIPPAEEVTDGWIPEGDTQAVELASPDEEGGRLPGRVERFASAADDALPVIEADAPDGGQAPPVQREAGGATEGPVNRIDVDAASPGLAVIPFKQSKTVSQVEAGITLANLLLSEIDSARFTLYERGQIAALLEEARFQEGELVDSTARAVEFGKLAGIRYLVIGEISSLGKLRWTARVIDCQTGQIVEKGSVSFDGFRAVDAAVAELLAVLKLNDAAVTVGQEPGAGEGQEAGDGDEPKRRNLTGHDLIDAANPDAVFELTVETGEGKQTYSEGETISFKVTAGADCFLTLVTVDPAGEMTLLLPNAWQRRAFVRKGESVVLPSSEMSFKFPIQPPHGRTLVKAIATKRPLRLRGVDADRLASEGFVAGGNLRDGVKAIGVAGNPEDVQSPGEPAALDQLFEPHEWATAMLVVDTREQPTSPTPPDPVDTAPADPTPTPDEPVTVRPPVRRPPLVPVTHGADPNDKLIELWQSLIGQQSQSTKSLDANPELRRTGRMFPGARRTDQVKNLLVVRRAQAAKNLGGNGRGYTTERIPIGQDTKSINETTWRAKSRSIQQDDASVITVVPDETLYLFNALPRTEFAPAQWALENSVHEECDTAWHKAVMQLPDADKFPLVGVVDQGLDLIDPRLKAFAWTNPGETPANGIDDDGNGFVDDIHGYHFALNSPELGNPGAPMNHGSYVASIIAARPVGRDDDLVGVAAGCRVISAGAMAWDPVAQTGNGSTGDIFRGMEYVADQGARIINLSLGGGGDKRRPPVSMERVLAHNSHPIWDRLEREGILVVIAAGNADTDNDQYPAIPANLSTLRSNIITVMAIDPAGQRARGYDPNRKQWTPYSNYGQKSVNIAAPGTAVLGISKPEVTCAYDGTSFAAPIVSGAAALLWAKHPDWDYKQIKRAILESARPVKGLEDKCTTGGMLDIEAALNWKP